MQPNTVIFILGVAATSFAVVQYEIIFEKAEIVFQNQNVARLNDCSFKRNGKSSITINASITVLKPVNLDNARVAVQVYIFYQNNYIHQPLKINSRVCNEYKKSTYVDFVELEKHGNITGCGIKKPGYYYVLNYTPILSLPDLPVSDGKYKVNVEVNSGKQLLASVDAYGSIQRRKT